MIELASLQICQLHYLIPRPPLFHLHTSIIIVRDLCTMLGPRCSENWLDDLWRWNSTVKKDNLEGDFLQYLEQPYLLLWHSHTGPHSGFHPFVWLWAHYKCLLASLLGHHREGSLLGRHRVGCLACGGYRETVVFEKHLWVWQLNHWAEAGCWDYHIRD